MKVDQDEVRNRCIARCKEYIERLERSKNLCGLGSVVTDAAALEDLDKMRDNAIGFGDWLGCIIAEITYDQVVKESHADGR